MNLTQTASPRKSPNRTPYDWDIATRCCKTIGAKTATQAFTLVDAFIAANGTQLGTPFFWDNRSPHAGFGVVGAKCFPARWPNGQDKELSYADIILHLKGDYNVFVSRNQGDAVSVTLFDLDVRIGANTLSDRIESIRNIISTFEVKTSTLGVRSPSSGVHIYCFHSQPLTPRQFETLKTTVHKTIGLCPGKVEMFPDRDRPLRLPLGAKSALMDLDTWGLIAGAEVVPSRTTQGKVSVRRNLATSLATFLKTASKAWGGPTPRAPQQPAKTHYDYKGKKPPILRTVPNQPLQTYLKEMETIETSGVTEYGKRYEQSGRLLWYLGVVCQLPLTESRMRYRAWLRLGSHRSRDLTGAKRNRVIASMERAAERSLQKLTLTPRQHGREQGVPSLKYLDTEIRNLRTIKGKTPSEQNPVKASLPWGQFPPMIGVGVCKMLWYLHERVHNGASGCLYISGREFQQVLGRDRVPTEVLQALPVEWQGCWSQFRGLAPVVRRILEQGNVLRLMERPVYGVNATKYEVCLDMLEEALVLPRDPVGSLAQYLSVRNPKEVASTWGVSPRLLTRILNGTSQMPATIQWALAEEAAFFPTLQGGDSSLLTGDRLMARKPASLKVVTVPAREESTMMKTFRSVMEARVLPKYLSPSEPPLPPAIPFVDRLATDWPEDFDRTRIPDTTDLARFTREASERYTIALECEQHDTLTPERQRALISLLRVSSGSPEGFYYGLLPILPRFPQRPTIPLRHLTNLPENFEKEAHRVLRAYNRVTSIHYKSGLWQGKPLLRARLSDLNDPKHQDRMKSVIGALYEASIMPERWVAWYCHRFIDHPKEPVGVFPSWSQMFGTVLIEKCANWCKSDSQVSLFAPGNVSCPVSLPRVQALQTHYYAMLHFLSFALLPSDGYVRSVVQKWFPGQSFGQEVAHCLVECDAAKEELERRYQSGEWIWT